MPAGYACRSLPFGPWTSTAPSSTLTVTPLGIVIGFLPIRDIISPDIAQHFAADADLDGFAPGHHAARGREDARSETGEHLGHIIATEIDAAPWAADPLDARDQSLAVRSVLQKDAKRLDGTGTLLDGTRARRAV